MLVLSRQLDETIMVGDDIEIKVVGIDRRQVRLGITAPLGVAVHRKEVWESIHRKSREAVCLGHSPFHVIRLADYR